MCLKIIDYNGGKLEREWAVIYYLFHLSTNDQEINGKSSFLCTYLKEKPLGWHHCCHSFGNKKPNSQVIAAGSVLLSRGTPKIWIRAAYNPAMTKYPIILMLMPYLLLRRAFSLEGRLELGSNETLKYWRFPQITWIFFCH